MWGQSVTDVLEEGQLRIRQTINSEMTPLVSILIEGQLIQDYNENLKEIGHMV